MSDPNTNRAVTATIKVPESKRYAADNPWLVFHGEVEAVRQQIIEAFNLANVDDLSLFEVTINAQRVASNVGLVSQQLGGTVIKQQASTQEQPPAAPAQADGDEDPTKPILAMIEAAPSRDALKTLWAENKALFDANPSLMDTWKNKGRALPS